MCRLRTFRLDSLIRLFKVINESTRMEESFKGFLLISNPNPHSNVLFVICTGWHVVKCLWDCLPIREYITQSSISTFFCLYTLEVSKRFWVSISVKGERCVYLPAVCKRQYDREEKAYFASVLEMKIIKINGNESFWIKRDNNRNVGMLPVFYKTHLYCLAVQFNTK